MENGKLFSTIRKVLLNKNIQGKTHEEFIDRFIGNGKLLHYLNYKLYSKRRDSHQSFIDLLELIVDAYLERSPVLKKQDKKKDQKQNWFLSNELVGMSLYVDRFAGTLKGVSKRLDYLKELGINLLHLMPLFESPENASDGGYAVSNYRVINARFGTLRDFKSLQKDLLKNNMYLMIDIVLNHTSDQHEWARKAKEGDSYYQDFYYVFDDRSVPDLMEPHMPEIFPESSPGSFVYNQEMKKWVMSVFHNYQWDLNFTNPHVLKAMLDTVFFYANLGVDILRVDAPAFIWKTMGTSCQNLPEAHVLLQLIKVALQIATPGTAILGEAIVAPHEIMDYFGKGYMTNKECDLAYNATQMALQWDAIATTDTRNMIANQEIIQQKPRGTTWINYVRCHDDIGLSFDDRYLEQIGYTPFLHRDYLKNYFAGNIDTSPSKGDLFAVNAKTNDARISGSLASLCGLEKAIEEQNSEAIATSVNKILLMNANSILLNGIPMIFYGDEAGYTNDYSYLSEKGKSYDNRWMHRPKINWSKNSKAKQKGTIEYQIFQGLKRIINIRKNYNLFSDFNNIEWLVSHNQSVVGFVRYLDAEKVFCLFNYSSEPQNLTYYVFDTVRGFTEEVHDLWSGSKVRIGKDHEHLSFKPYQFFILHVTHKNLKE